LLKSHGILPIIMVRKRSRGLKPDLCAYAKASATRVCKKVLLMAYLTSSISFHVFIISLFLPSR